MSYRNFRDEVLEELGRTLKSGERESIWSALGGRISRAVNRKSAWSAWSEKVMRTLPDAQRVVFWRWFKAERYPELVYWLVDNFDTGGGDEYLDSLSERLSELREVQLLTRLWRGSISNRRRAKKRNEVVSAYQRFARALSICGLASDRAAALEELGRPDEARAEIQAALALDPKFTIRRFRAGAQSDNPVFLKQRERAMEGMRKAGAPEG